MAKMIMTVAEMADRDAWLKMRTQGIGGSDAGTIVGLNPWKSKYELWLEKTGQVVPEDISDREPVYWGNRLEDIVAQEFTRQTGKKVRRHGMVQDEAHPFLFANVDRMVAGEKAGLECKTANGFKASLWEGDEVPASYYCQCQHYMLVTGLPIWYIACLVGGQHYVYKPIKRNEEDIQTLLEKEDIMLIEQNAQKVLEFCDQAYIMQVGKVAISGRGRDLLEDNAVAAAYLGD